jgi:hypothetical protein
MNGSFEVLGEPNLAPNPARPKSPMTSKNDHLIGKGHRVFDLLRYGTARDERVGIPYYLDRVMQEIRLNQFNRRGIG